ncbi:hypothetical protein HNQ51_001154 [Inhella inkyongensis]|uniref:Urease accessory protein UreH-like transmembrane domain-containing protein n=1 Tax=Inhella inkyongensis TaxID=392593 RepID=A0A840S5F5_9BURK|nr:sulfite exporter TauE/SafE family protein [Inhella inkyongensis]MBB5203861.1 hypothetical protein [Inhella inkyongensis]
MIISTALVTSTALMGLASIPHCALMCGAPCAAVATGRSQQLGFHVLRVASYALAGALAAAAVGWLREASQLSALLRPLWTVLHTAFLALGLWLLWRAELPAWLGLQGRKPMRLAWTSGALWAAWPCGVLQAALLVAALADTPVGGALAMAAFALASSPGLLWAPLGLRQLRRHPEAGRWAVRAAGLALVLAALWALGHGLWQRVAAYCFS